MVTKRLRYLLDGVDAHTVAAGIRRSATKLGIDKSRRERVETCARYLCKYAEHLRYADYLAAGYPIATGVIAASCSPPWVRGNYATNGLRTCTVP